MATVGFKGLIEYGIRTLRHTTKRRRNASELRTADNIEVFFSCLIILITHSTIFIMNESSPGRYEIISEVFLLSLRGVC